MQWLILAGTYLSAHLLLYIFLLRELKPFRQENLIFLYHVLSFFLSGFALFIWFRFIPQDKSLAILVLLLSLHGIYSLSFLELWTLSEGGYSLRILEILSQGYPITSESSLSKFNQMAASKKGNRLRGLQSLNLVREDAESFQLTRFGRMMVTGLQGIAALANLQGKT